MSDKPRFPVRPQACPVCQSRLACGIVLNDGGMPLSAMPSRGDVAVCGFCSEALCFDGGHFRSITPAHRAMIAQEFPAVAASLATSETAVRAYWKTRRHLQ